MDFEDGGMIVQNKSKSSLVSDVKAKQNDDLAFAEHRKAIFGMSIKVFSRVECFYIRYIYVS